MLEACLSHRDWRTSELSRGRTELPVVGGNFIWFDKSMLLGGTSIEATDELSRLSIPHYSSNQHWACGGFGAAFEPSESESNLHDTSDTYTQFYVTVDGDLQTTLTARWNGLNFAVSGASGVGNNSDVIVLEAAGNRVPDFLTKRRLSRSSSIIPVYPRRRAQRW